LQKTGYTIPVDTPDFYEDNPNNTLSDKCIGFDFVVCNKFITSCGYIQFDWKNFMNK
jgi:hypothetical protein